VKVLAGHVTAHGAGARKGDDHCLATGAWKGEQRLATDNARQGRGLEKNETIKEEQLETIYSRLINV
jgi:hypothetical protein